MSALRIPTLTCVAVLTAQVAAASPVYTQYRGVSIGDSPGVVVAALKMTPADVVVVTARPTLVEQVTWRPNQFFTGRTGPADDLWEMVLTFHRGRLARIVATYERDRTAGMTDADLHAAFTATYGTAMLVPTPTTAVVAGEPLTIGRWGDANTVVVLWREDYPRRIHVSISSVAEDRTMQEAIASGKRLDAIEAPAREIVRRATDDFTLRQRTEKTRGDNKATFKP
jgi:hypothetical protein